MNQLAEFDLTPAVSLWLLIPGLLTALVLSAILYRDQRRMAPVGMVVALTAIRLLLIFMIAIVLLQPAIKWTQEKVNAGTLWIVVDQSPSMQTSDPQAEGVERLRWARGLGYLPAVDSVDLLQARTHMLRDEITGMTPEASGGDERKSIAAFADRIEAWISDLEKLNGDVARNFEAMRGSTAQETRTNLERAVNLAKNSLTPVRRAASLPMANEALRRWEIGNAMGLAERNLAERANAVDAAAFAAVKGDAAITRVGNLSRNTLAHGILAGTESPAAELLQELAKKYRVRLASFSDKLQTAGTVDSSELREMLRSSLLPAGQATSIAGGLQGVAEQISLDEAASVLIISDGRTNVPGDPTGPARNLASRGVRVYGLLVGSHEVSPDAAVEPVDFPEWIYKGNSIRARAVIRLDGLAEKDAVVQLRRATGSGDASAGLVIDSRSLRITGNHETRPFEFTDTPPETDKPIEYEIRVSEMPGEVNTQNNVATFRVAVKKEKLYALIIEDRPRWEFRYLAAFLSRRQGMGVQTILLQPAVVAGVSGPPPEMASPDNPHEEAQILPRTLEDWQKFDVIVLGDVGPEILTPQMQQFLASTVRDKGADIQAACFADKAPAYCDCRRPGGLVEANP